MALDLWSWVFWYFFLGLIFSGFLIHHPMIRIGINLAKQAIVADIDNDDLTETEKEEVACILLLASFVLSWPNILIRLMMR